MKTAMKTVARFEIDYVQYLDEQSKVVAPLPEFAQHPENLLAMYKSMVLARVLDGKAVNLQRMGKLSTYPSSLGQEAVSAGVAYAMAQDDIFCPHYRDQAGLLYRGMRAAEILGFWGGDERASRFSSSKIQQDFPMAVPIASQCLHAAGVAYAIQLRQEKKVAVSSCGDGGTSEGEFYEAMNFAGVRNLPCIFVVNNNQWAISVPLSLQTAAQTLAQKAIAAGFVGIQVDGNDVIAVREATQAAIAKARQGAGPTLIEAVTYRLCDHTTADDAKRYSDPKVLEQAWQREPIKRLRVYLEQLGVWSEEQEKKLMQECTAKIDQEIQDYLQVPTPSRVEMIDFLYAELPAELQEQRAELAEGETK